MKSKIIFDINSQNKAVVTAQIINSEDVRDKIACKFIETLGGTGSLALITFDSNHQREGSVIEFSSFYGIGDDTKELLSKISMDQLLSIQKELPNEISKREQEKKKIAKIFLNKTEK